MLTLENLTDPKSNFLFKPLSESPGFHVCRVCFAPILDTFTICFQCREHSNSGLDIADVVIPISMAIEKSHPDILSQFPYELLEYKKPENPGCVQLQNGLAGILWRWLIEHEKCIYRKIDPGSEFDDFEDGPFDLVTSVPSTSGQRIGIHPLQRILTASIPLTMNRYKTLLAPSAIVTPAHTINGSKFEFVGSRSKIYEKNVLLVEDTWTTGANVQSAVHALKSAGAGHVAVLVVGRWVTPSRGEPFKSKDDAYIAQIRTTTWDWSKCAFCS